MIGKNNLVEETLINYNKGNIDVKNRHLDITREGKSGMICENTTETCTLP